MRFNPLCAVLTFFVLSLPTLYSQSVSKVVVFGDSLSDNGNAAAALASVGKTLGNYAANALTDGPSTVPATSGPYGLWIDQFAALLGVSDPQPFVAYMPLGATGGILVPNASGTNFAVASALAGNNPNFSSTNYLNAANPQVPGTTNQVKLFLSFNEQHASAENLMSFGPALTTSFNHSAASQVSLRVP
jgi:phospholipase/lecithinase/hemolysin